MASPADSIFYLPWICTHHAEVHHVKASDISESGTVQQSDPPPFESLHLESRSAVTTGIASETIAPIRQQ